MLRINVFHFHKYFLFKKLEYSLAPFRHILLDIHIIHQFPARFGLWYLLFANGTPFSLFRGKWQKIHIKSWWAFIILSIIDWLIIYGFTSRSRSFYLYRDVTIAGEGLQNLGICSALRAFEQGGIFIVPHLLWNGTSVFPFSSFSCLLRHMRGCVRYIPTRILTGSFFQGSYHTSLEVF
jgi:hypothetical protein